MFLVTEIWRSALNIGQMRLKSTLPDAITYAQQLYNQSPCVGSRFRPSAYVRIYLISDNSPPILQKDWDK